MNPETILTQSGKLLQVHVQPNKRQTAIVGWDAATKVLTVAVAAPPDKDKANLELLRFLRRFFRKPVTLVRGAKSKEKVVRFDD